MKQILIALNDEEYEDIISDEACGLHPLTRAVARGTVLPDNPTNGDMIKTMFPNILVNDGWTEGLIVAHEFDGSTWFNKEWWNAPYKRGE